MIQFLAIVVFLWICCSSAAVAFVVPSSLFGSHKRQTRLCAVNPLDRDDDLNYPQISNDPYHKLFHLSDYSSPRLFDEQVYIILFKPDTQDEGAHTIEYPKGSGNNVILAFLSKHECDTFANLLKEQELWDPTTQEMNLQNLQDYCHSIGVTVQVVPRGMNLIPPTERVETLNHDPNLRDRKNSLEYLIGITNKDPGALFNDNDSSWE